jgi:uncharacterized protein YndB with AHSA1/START domain
MRIAAHKFNLVVDNHGQGSGKPAPQQAGITDMSEFGRLIEPSTFQIQRLLPGPIERVWSYLVESEKRRKWFARGEFDLRPGGRIDLIFKHSELSAEKDYPEKYKKIENGHSSQGEVVRCEPPRLIAFTWGDDSGAPFSEVTFELTPQDGKVLLTLTHRKLKDRGEAAGVAGGWHAHLAMLEDELAGREHRGFWSVHGEVAPQYEARIAKD